MAVQILRLTGLLRKLIHLLLTFSVFEELQLITKQHYIALEKLVQDQGLPVLQQHERQSQAPTTSRTRTSSYTQPIQKQYPAASQYGYAPAMY